MGRDWYYVGKLAGREVVARFRPDAQGMLMPGSYFYRDTGREVVLFYDEARRRFIECPPTWQEEETVNGCDEPGGYWDVQLLRNAVLVDWRARIDDQPLKAVLTRASPLPGGADLDAQVAALRVAGPRLAGPEQGHGAVRWHTVTEPRSKASMPFLTRAPVAAAMRRINASLEQRFRRQIRTALFNTARANGEADYDSQAFVTGTRYFAITESASSCSGGAHGHFNLLAATFDLKNGQPVQPGKRYHIGPFKRAGRETAGFSLVEQARAQRQTAVPSSRQRLSRGDRSKCWETGWEAGMRNKNGAGTGGAEDVPENSAWTVFPAEHGLAIAYNGFPVSLSYCLADYRVIPWPQAACAPRLPASTPGCRTGNQTQPG